MRFASLITNNAEELAEGALLALMTAGAVVPQDETLASKAMQVAGAATLGVGMGIGARHIGARLGRRWGKGAPLKNPTVASFARMTGSESIAGGLGAQGRLVKETIERDLRETTAKSLLRQAEADPETFARTYGMDPAAFLKGVESGTPLQGVSAVASALKDMPPERRAEAVRTLKEAMPEPLRNALDADDLIAGQASGKIDSKIRQMAADLKERFPEGVNVDSPGLEHMKQGLGPMAGLFEGKTLTAEKLLSLLDPVEPVTGEHLGRAIGRFAGDEIGAILGQSGGLLLARAMGLGKQPAEQDEQRTAG